MHGIVDGADFFFFFYALIIASLGPHFMATRYTSILDNNYSCAPHLQLNKMTYYIAKTMIIVSTDFSLQISPTIMCMHN
jgi:hypothetical protein